MATEETETEEGGQTDDSGDTGSDESDTDPGEGEGGESAAAAEKPTRTQRRANRFQEERNARQRAEQELAEWRGRHTALESQFAEFRQQIERDRQQAQQADAGSQARQKINSVREQAWNYLAAASQAKTVAEAKELRDKYQELMDEADDMRDEMRDESRWERRRGELNQGPSAELMGEQMYFLSKYPWLDGHEEAQKMIRARFESLVSSGKRQANRATMEEAVTGIGKLLRLGGTANGVSDRSRQVYAGMGQRDGEHDNSEPSGSMSVEEVENSLAFRKMAQLTYPELEPRQAYAKWAKMQGGPAKNGAGAR